jgi:hypothetical protein
MSQTVVEGVDIQSLMDGRDNRILVAEPRTRHRLHLEYADGSQYDLDMTPLLAKGGVMQPLTEDAVFAQVKVILNGRAIAFTDEIDFCADSLRVDCELQRAGFADPWSMDI